MSPVLATAIDIAVIALLAVTIAYCWRLHARLATIRRGRDEMKKVTDDFAQATANAELAVRGMKAAAREDGEKLQDKLREAQALVDELNFMLGAGSDLAERLERAVDARNEAAPAGADPAEGAKTAGDRAANGADRKAEGPVSRAESELKSALERMR